MPTLAYAANGYVKSGTCLEAYETTLRFIDRVRLTVGEKARLEPLLRKMEARSMLSYRLTKQPHSLLPLWGFFDVRSLIDTRVFRSRARNAGYLPGAVA